MRIDQTAYWYREGLLIRVQTTHIAEMIHHPELFGMTSAHIEDIYRRFGEPAGHEGYAREQLMTEAMQNGWIRARRRLEKEGVMWIIQFSGYHERELQLKELVKNLLYKQGEMNDGQDVLFSDISGGYEKRYSSWSGEPVSAFAG